jgi:hypothetical protein
MSYMNNCKERSQYVRTTKVNVDWRVVVGFNGVNSIIGSWLGLEKPNRIGQF